MSIGSANYHIGQSSRVCAVSNKPLLPGDQVITALIELPEDGNLERRDYLPDCWDQGQALEQGVRLVGHWKAIVPEPGQKKGLTIDRSSLRDLFAQLSEATDHKGVVLRYVLSLILIRKRVLVVLDANSKGMTVRERGANAQIVHEVVDPQMDETAIEDVIEQLGQVLGDIDDDAETSS